MNLTTLMMGILILKTYNKTKDKSRKTKVEILETKIKQNCTLEFFCLSFPKNQLFYLNTFVFYLNNFICFLN